MRTYSTVEKVASPLKGANQVKDERLEALYAYKAGKEILDEKNKQALGNLADANREEILGGKAGIDLNVSFGTSKSETKIESQTTIGQGSTINAGGNINITATEGDLTIKGSQVQAEDILLKAKENVNLQASQNQNQTTEDTKSSSASIGVNIGASGITGININASTAKGEIKENGTTYNQTEITAGNKLTIESGKDTNIIGSTASGEKVEIEVGGNLNIESLQDKQTYDEKNSSAGIGINTDLLNKGKTSITGGINKGKIESDYQSVTDQAGIYAGQEGFDIQVGGNTDLKGAVIASEATAGKNKLSTDTLTYEDIKNKAEYEASSAGINVNTSKDAKLNEKGVTPNIGVTAKDDAESTTKSAIAEGTVEVRGEKDKDLSGLSRDTENALNKLGEIFDKETIQEKQELAGLFGELAFEEIHKLSVKNGWKKGSPEKIALHALIGGIMAELGGGNALSGAAAAGVNEAIQKQLNNIDDPGLHQIASALIGGIVGKIVGGDASTGASVAASATKNNDLAPTEQNELAYKIKNAGTDKDEIIQLLQDAAIGDHGPMPNGTEENLINALEEAGYTWDNNKDFKGNIATATACFQQQEGKDIGEQYTHSEPQGSNGNTADKTTQQAMENQNQTETIDTGKITEGIGNLINWLNPEEIGTTGEKIPGYMEKGAVIYSGGVYYGREMGENGTDGYIEQIKPGSYCYNENQELCIIGDDWKPKQINWGKETAIAGGLNTPIQIEVAKNENGETILVDGKPIIKPESQKDYLEHLKELKEEEKPVDGKGELLAGALTKPGTSGSVSEGSSKAEKILYSLERKIVKQMEKRGWSNEMVSDTINNPIRTVKTSDTRNNPLTGTKNNDSATAYYNRDGGYVVRNDRTGDIVQVSDRNDPNWVAPWGE